MLKRLFWPYGYTVEPDDPIARGKKLFLRKLRNYLIAFVSFMIAIIVFGVPSIQGDYRYSPGVIGTPKAMDKLDADYWNPITGWRTVVAGEFAPGCPVVIFTPLRECLDLKPYRNWITTRILGKEFFDGP